MSNNTSSSINASASTSNDRAIIFYSDYNVVVSNDGTIHWNTSNYGALNLVKLTMLAASFAAKLGTDEKPDCRQLINELASNVDIQLLEESLDLGDDDAFHSIGDITIYNDGFIRIRGTQCGRVNIFSLATRLTGLFCKLRNMVRQ